MSAYRVASRYAKSLLELAVETNVLESVHEDMKGVLNTTGQSPELVDLIKSPVITSDQKMTVIRALFGKNVAPLTLKFFELVSKKGRESLLPEMARGFHRLYNQHMGIQTAEVVATIQLDQALRDSFIAIVKEYSGKDRVELIEKIDPNLIGGFVLNIEDRQLDESIKSKLQQLRLGFTQNLYEKKY
ncbi:ATP synthase F1 subcomplex delta subunit [Cyclobacterium xiamenense]|uniref:ATP synthase subunit delta n=1 Tax=Cyclobacterium xiamenense TaxID=1297121 RepID=A0A1H6XYJ2_9BACT|nr:ATP synthase F1 subunit delta [Cyclobacterium xiamenense]SEJ31827.1 ATP synthase F1 subcomplex delta subunit [Cyclobacterium xiamenense]